MHVLELRRLGLEEVAQRGSVCFRRLFPIFLDGVPALAQAFFIGIAILRNDGLDPLGMGERQTKSDRRTVIEDIDGVALEPDSLSETVHQNVYLNSARAGASEKPKPNKSGATM